MGLEVKAMNREAKKLLAVNCLYAVIPLLLMLVPLLFSGLPK